MSPKSINWPRSGSQEMATSGWRGCIYRSEGIWWQNHTDIHRWEKNEQGVGAGVAIFSGNELVTKLKYKLGTTAVFELQSLPHQHQCRCCAYFKFSVIRIPFPFRFLVSPPFPHPQCITHPVCHLQLQRESGASRILFTTCSYNGKMVVRTARGVSKQIEKHLLLFSYY